MEGVDAKTTNAVGGVGKVHLPFLRPAFLENRRHFFVDEGLRVIR